MEIFSASNNGNGNGKDGLHVLMFPWLAHGHISAFIHLSTTLAAKGVRISFLSTPVNISRIKPLFLQENKSSPVKLQLVELELPSVDGLPPGIENTADLPSVHLMPLLKKAIDGLEKPFQALLREIRPDVVVFDVIQHWVPAAAADLAIPTVSFSSFNAVTTSYVFGHSKAAKIKEEMTAEDLMKPPAHFPSTCITLRPFEARAILSFFTEKSEIAADADRVVGCFGECSAMAVKTCSEIEDDKFRKYLEMISGKPVFALGPLLPCEKGAQVEDADAYCLRWLEKQEASSVVYVSFGTEVVLSEEQIEEIAVGLETSGQAFVWALRRGSDCLPGGFEDRTRDRGLITRWAPQREILSHDCTGGFLTHCGWNSLMEGMSAGLPLIALPIQNDQGLNARLIVEELKIGVEVERGEHGEFKADDICKALKKIMEEEEEGREFRLKAAEMGNVFNTKILCQDEDGSQNKCIDKFIVGLRELKGVA